MDKTCAGVHRADWRDLKMVCLYELFRMCFITDEAGPGFFKGYKIHSRIKYFLFPIQTCSEKKNDIKSFSCFHCSKICCGQIES